MKFVWDIKEKDWDEYPVIVRNADEPNFAGVVGMVRVGNLVFDLRAWGSKETGEIGLGYELFVGGVDNGYNETLDGYPYDMIGYGEFEFSVTEMYLSDFEKWAEPKLEAFIKQEAKNYTLADLLVKADEPTNYNL